MRPLRPPGHQHGIYLDQGVDVQKGWCTVHMVTRNGLRLSVTCHLQYNSKRVLSIRFDYNEAFKKKKLYINGQEDKPFLEKLKKNSENVPRRSFKLYIFCKI